MARVKGGTLFISLLLCYQIMLCGRDMQRRPYMSVEAQALSSCHYHNRFLLLFSLLLFHNFFLFFSILIIVGSGRGSGSGNGSGSGSGSGGGRGSGSGSGSGSGWY